MAVLTLRSAQQTPQYGGDLANRLYPMDEGGKLRILRASIAALAAAGDIGTTIELCRIPQGRSRLLPYMSRLWTTAYGAARVLDIGVRAYYGSDGKTVVAENANQIANDIDVSAALAASMIDPTSHIDYFAQASVDERDKGPMIFATIAGGTIPVGATLEAMFVFITY